MHIPLKLSTLTGKTLPVPFGLSFVSLINEKYGWSIYQSAIKAGREDLEVPEEYRLEWTLKLLDYLRESSTRQPLDYTLLAILYYGVQIQLSPTEHIILARTKGLGHDWWKNCINPLCKILDEAIHSFIKNETPVAKQDIFLRYLQAFSAAFDEQAGIKSQVHLMGDNLAVTFGDCPFCLNQLDSCRIFHGVISGLIGWIDEVEVDKVTSQNYKIHESSGSAHTVVLRLEK